MKKQPRIRARYSRGKPPRFYLSDGRRYYPKPVKNSDTRTL